VLVKHWRSNTQAYFLLGGITMRELTDQELDAICGGLFDFTAIKQIMINQLNEAKVQQTGLVNNITQLNIGIAEIQ
jgi:hypothetical protein